MSTSLVSHLDNLSPTVASSFPLVVEVLNRDLPAVAASLMPLEKAAENDPVNSEIGMVPAAVLENRETGNVLDEVVIVVFSAVWDVNPLSHGAPFALDMEFLSSSTYTFEQNHND